MDFAFFSMKTEGRLTEVRLFFARGESFYENISFIDNIFEGFLHSMGEPIDVLPNSSVDKYWVIGLR